MPYDGDGQAATDRARGERHQGARTRLWMASPSSAVIGWVAQIGPIWADGPAAWNSEGTHSK
jgi:hypothetical protein